MSNPSPSAIQAIDSRVQAISSWAKTDSEILSDLLLDKIPNPVAQTNVYKSFTYNDIKVLLTTSLASVRDCGLLPRILDDISVMNRYGLYAWAETLLATPSVITQAEHDAIIALVFAQIPDPNYQTELINIEYLIGRPVDINDIQMSRAV